MDKLYTNRDEAKQGCEYEATTAIRYAEAAISYAREGKTGAAWRMAEIAHAAAKCAAQAHDELWELTDGELTDAEFEAFEKAEIALIKANAAADKLNK